MKKLLTLFALIFGIFTTETSAWPWQKDRTNYGSIYGTAHYTSEQSERTTLSQEEMCGDAKSLAVENTVSLGLIGGGVALLHTPVFPLGIIFIVVGGLYQVSQRGIVGGMMRSGCCQMFCQN